MTPMRLYHVPNTRSTRVLWLLEEIGAPYDLTLMTGDERRGEEHASRHPLGRVPVIEDEEGFVFESLAILLHIADLHPEAGLIPPPGSHDRALAYQWSVFAMTELEPAVLEVFRCSPRGGRRAHRGCEDRFPGRRRGRRERARRPRVPRRRRFHGRRPRSCAAVLIFAAVPS